ncbi:MAG: hypothetical protein V4734_09640 [Terriglobus sp.]
MAVPLWNVEADITDDAMSGAADGCRAAGDDMVLLDNSMVTQATWLFQSALTD